MNNKSELNSLVCCFGSNAVHDFIANSTFKELIKSQLYKSIYLIYLQKTLHFLLVLARTLLFITLKPIAKYVQNRYKGPDLNILQP